MPPSDHEPGDGTPLDDDYPLAPDPLRALADWSLADMVRQRVLTSELIDYLRGEHE